jgi:hypothetical protein
MSESQISTIITILIRSAQISILGFLALIAWMGWQVSRRETPNADVRKRGAYVPRIWRAHRSLFPASRLRQTALVIVALCVGCLLSSSVLIHQQRNHLAAEMLALEHGDAR